MLRANTSPSSLERGEQTRAPHLEGLQRSRPCGLAGLTSLCPAVNPSSVMSPAGSSQAEEQQYLDKLKQLSKYIEPLRRMINKIDKNEGEGGACTGVGAEAADSQAVS